MSRKVDTENLDWWGYNISNPRQYTKCLKNLVKQCRASFEYDIWQKESKHSAGDTCPICGVEYIYSRPETHHYPKTLFEVVEDEFQELVEKNKLDEIEPLEFVRLVMKKHLAGLVSHVVLCKHCHAKYHDMDPETIKQVEKLYQESRRTNEQQIERQREEIREENS